MKVTVLELEADLARYLSEANAGDEVTITDGKESIARIVPVAETTLDRLIREGLVIPARRAKQPAPTTGIVPSGSVSDLIAEQRA